MRRDQHWYGWLLVVAIGGFAGTAAGAVTWRPNVPDFFQHQRWGSDGTIPGGAAGAGDPTWEANYSPAVPAGPGGVPPAMPEDGGFGGWCWQTAVTNQLYYFRQRGYRTFGPAIGAATDPTTVADVHDQIKLFDTDYGATFDGNPKSTSKRINEILTARGTGPDKGLDGLLSQNLLQQGASIYYRNAKGQDTKFGKGTLYDHVQAIDKAGDLSNLRLTYEASSSKLWWEGPNPGRGNFHVVTVAGIDTAGDGTLWFADPDSNKGNANANAGWSADIIDWKAAPAGVPEKARRYNGGDAYRLAGAAPANNAERDLFYYPGTLATTKTAFSIPAGASDRYDDVEIKYLETMETIKGVSKPAPAPGGPPPGAAKKFQVSPGAGSSSIINELWLYPSRSIEKLINLISSGFGGTAPASAWNWTLMPGVGDAPSSDPFLPAIDNIPGLDRYGNPRDEGGLYLTVNSANPFWIGRSLGLLGNELLEFEYETLGGVPLEGWDFLYNDFSDTSLLSLGVQTFGGNSGYELPTLQIPVPEPNALLLLVLGGVAFVGSRRRR